MNIEQTHTHTYCINQVSYSQPSHNRINIRPALAVDAKQLSIIKP